MDWAEVPAMHADGVGTLEIAREAEPAAAGSRLPR